MKSHSCLTSISHPYYIPSILFMPLNASRIYRKTVLSLSKLGRYQFQEIAKYLDRPNLHFHLDVSPFWRFSWLVGSIGWIVLSHIERGHKICLLLRGSEIRRENHPGIHKIL